MIDWIIAIVICLYPIWGALAIKCVIWFTMPGEMKMQKRREWEARR